MAKVKEIPTSHTSVQYHFQCLGCDQEHAFNDEIWTWNHDFNNPTLSPSFLMRGKRYNESTKDYSIPFICHSFIKNGFIEYLNDCTHHLKGKRVELPEYE